MNIKEIVNNKSPVILAGLGIAGFITAIIMATKVAPTAKEILEEEPEDIPFVEKVKLVGPLYAPTVGMACLSTACIIGSGRIYTHRYASLFGLYSLGEETLRRWQTHALEQVGKNKFEKIQAKVIAPEEPVPQSMIINDEKVLFYDAYSGRYFKFDSVESVRKVINDTNDIMYQDGWVALNEFYYGLGLPRTQFGDDIGWDIANGSIGISLEAVLHENRPCVVIVFTLTPKKY